MYDLWDYGHISGNSFGAHRLISNTWYFFLYFLSFFSFRADHRSPCEWTTYFEGICWRDVLSISFCGCGRTPFLAAILLASWPLWLSLRDGDWTGSPSYVAWPAAMARKRGTERIFRSDRLAIARGPTFTLSTAVKPVGRNHARKMEKITSERRNLWTEDIALKLRRGLRRQDKKLTLPKRRKNDGVRTHPPGPFPGLFSRKNLRRMKNKILRRRSDSPVNAGSPRAAKWPFRDRSLLGPYQRTTDRASDWMWWRARPVIPLAPPISRSFWGIFIPLPQVRRHPFIRSPDSSLTLFLSSSFFLYLFLFPLRTLPEPSFFFVTPPRSW